MAEQIIVGLSPWLPAPLSWSAWWTKPVRAERLAVLRIGVAAVLLAEVLISYLPHVTDYYGAGSLGRPGVFDWTGEAPRWWWSIFRGVESPAVFYAAVGVVGVAAVLLLLGWFSRTSAVVAWVILVSLGSLNSYMENSGADVRNIILFYLMLCPAGAAWSLDRRLGRWQRLGQTTAFVHPWPLRLLFIQMTLIYFFNGCYKISGNDWRTGQALYYVLGDLSLSRWSYILVPLPDFLTRLCAWTVLAWEVSFPLWVAAPAVAGWFSPRAARVLRWVRVVFLLFGVLFHLGIWLTMEVGWFSQYMLCLYLPLLPWEEWAERWRRRHEPIGAPTSAPEESAPVPATAITTTADLG